MLGAGGSHLNHLTSEVSAGGAVASDARTDETLLPNPSISNRPSFAMACRNFLRIPGGRGHACARSSTSIGVPRASRNASTLSYAKSHSQQAASLRETLKSSLCDARSESQQVAALKETPHLPTFEFRETGHDCCNSVRDSTEVLRCACASDGKKEETCQAMSS